jgi:hypothetical protein
MTDRLHRVQRRAETSKAARYRPSRRLLAFGSGSQPSPFTIRAGQFIPCWSLDTNSKKTTPLTPGGSSVSGVKGGVGMSTCRSANYLCSRMSVKRFRRGWAEHFNDWEDFTIGGDPQSIAFRTSRSDTPSQAREQTADQIRGLSAGDEQRAGRPGPSARQRRGWGRACRRGGRCPGGSRRYRWWRRSRCR